MQTSISSFNRTLEKSGEKGGHESSGRKSMETRAERECKSVHDVASEMGSKGVSHSHAGTSKKKEESEE